MLGHEGSLISGWKLQGDVVDDGKEKRLKKNTLKNIQKQKNFLVGRGMLDWKHMVSHR